MFISGVFTATGVMHYNLFTVCSVLIVASLSGSMTGYWFGRKAGPVLYNRTDSKFFRREHLEAAEKFYAKYGGLALTAGSFLPIIRTFAPIVAGMIKVNLRRFLLFTITGSVLWVLSFVLAGYLIGSMPFLKPYLKYIISGIIILVTTPMVIRIVKEYRKVKTTKENFVE